MKLIVCILFLIFNFPPKYFEVSDSLLKNQRYPLTDTALIDSLFKMSDQYALTQPSIAIAYAKEALRLQKVWDLSWVLLPHIQG